MVSLLTMIMVDQLIGRNIEWRRVKNHEQEGIPLYTTIVTTEDAQSILMLKERKITNLSENFKEDWEDQKRAYIESNKKDGWIKLKRLVQFLETEDYMMKKLAETMPPYYDLERIDRQRKMGQRNHPLLFEDEMTIKMRFAFQFQILRYYMQEHADYDYITSGYSHDSFKREI